MSTANEPERHGRVYTFEVFPVDEDEQDRLNRLLRRPNDPPYDPTAKWLDPPKSASGKIEDLRITNGKE
jgi:hypothetical protein